MVRCRTRGSVHAIDARAYPVATTRLLAPQGHTAIIGFGSEIRPLSRRAQRVPSVSRRSKELLIPWSTPQELQKPAPAFTRRYNAQRVTSVSDHRNQIAESAHVRARTLLAELRLKALVNVEVHRARNVGSVGWRQMASVVRAGIIRRHPFAK